MRLPRRRLETAGGLAFCSEDGTSWWAWQGADGTHLVGGGTRGVALARALTTIVAHTFPPGRAGRLRVEIPYSARSLADLTHVGDVAIEVVVGSSPLVGAAAARMRWEMARVDLGEVGAPARGESVIVATDGSYHSESGLGVWYWYASPEAHGSGLMRARGSEEVELVAIEKALAALHEGGVRQATLQCDCLGLLSQLGFTRRGRRRGPVRVAQREPAWAERIEAARASIDDLGVRVRWVEGHGAEKATVARGHQLADVRSRRILRAHLALAGPGGLIPTA